MAARAMTMHTSATVGRNTWAGGWTTTWVSLSSMFVVVLFTVRLLVSLLMITLSPLDSVTSRRTVGAASEDVASPSAASAGSADPVVVGGDASPGVAVAGDVVGDAVAGVGSGVEL